MATPSRPAFDPAGLITEQYRVGPPTEIKLLHNTRNVTYEVRTADHRYALRVRGGDSTPHARYSLDEATMTSTTAD